MGNELVNKKPFVPADAVFVDGIFRTTENGKSVAFVQLKNGSVAKITEGTGADVEKATLIAGGDQSKYMSAMMAGTIEIDGQKIVTEQLSELSMRDYMKIQVPFAEINF